MYPLAFGSYGTYLPTLIAIAPIPMILLFSLFRREGVPPLRVSGALLCLLGAALAGGKIFSLASRGWPDISWANELTGGMRFSGIVICSVLALPLVKRWFLPGVALARSADILALTLVVAVCFGRLACIMAGCCTGAIGEGLLHFAYPPGSKVWYMHLQSGVIANSQQWSEPVLALPVLFLVASAGAAIFLLRYDRHRHYDGQVFLLFLLAHELPKSALELLRVPLVPAQLTATLAVGLLGLFGLLYFHFNPPERAQLQVSGRGQAQ